MFDFGAMPVYVPSSTDKYWESKKEESKGKSGPVPALRVNLNEITYYAKMGLTPKRIAPIIGVSTPIIYQFSPLFQAYERGRAWHVLWLNSSLMEHARVTASAATNMLDRVDTVDELTSKKEEDPLAGKSDAELAEMAEQLTKSLKARK